MKRNDATIEIECPCGTVNYLEFDRSFQDCAVTCRKCGRVTYWHSCPRCETGYYDFNSEGVCPECTPTPEVIRADRVKWKFLKKPCPWCGYPVSVTGLNAQIVPSCPSCKKYYEVTGFPMFVLIFMVSMGILAKVSVEYIKPAIKDLPVYEPAVVFLGMAIAFISFVIASKGNSVRRYTE